MVRRIVGWFRDRAVRRVVRYGVPAALGKLVMSLAGLVTTALLARQLGPGPFGVIAVIRTVVAIVDQYANFNTWQAIVKYGTEAQAAHRTRDVERVIKLAVVIDVATGVLAALVILGLAYAIPSTFSWTAHEGMLCALYGVTLFTRVAGASDGIFRICDAYRAQAISSSIGALAMTAAVGVAVAVDASFDGCVYALVGGEVISNLVVTAASFRVARERGFGGWARASLASVRTSFQGIVHFLVATNAQLTVKKTAGELDMVIVGAMLGKVSSGLYRIVKQLGSIPGRIFMPFEQVVFTELARAAAAHDYAGFKRLLRRFTGLVGLGSLVIWAIAAVASAPIIRLVAGDEFVGAADSFRWFLLAVVLLIVNSTIMRALIALGRPGTLFIFDLGSLGVLAAGLWTGAHYWGLVGVSVAVLAYRALQLLYSTWFVAHVVKQRQALVS